MRKCRTYVTETEARKIVFKRLSLARIYARGYIRKLSETEHDRKMSIIIKRVHNLDTQIAKYTEE